MSAQRLMELLLKLEASGKDLSKVDIFILEKNLVSPVGEVSVQTFFHTGET